MSRHQKAINRFIGVVFSVPLTLVTILFLFQNPFTKNYLIWTSPVTIYYFYTFLLIGLVAILFELPFTRPDMLAGSSAGKFGTALVASVGIIAFIFASLIISGYYNISTDTSYVGLFLQFLYLPASMLMFSVELFDILIRNRRFAIHKYAGA